MRSDLLIHFGGALKVLETKGDLVTIGGQAVLYDEPGTTRKDLTGEYFTKSTFLGHTKGDMAMATFHHGFPVKGDSEFAVGLSEHLFSHAWRTEDTDEALVASLVTDMRNKYERFTAEKVMAGEVSLSSGATGHVVRKKDDGQITVWPIGEIAVTPTPAEPRLGLLSTKSFLGLESTKAESLSARVDRVYNAWYSLDTDYTGWPVEIFDDHVIVQWGETMYRVAYTDDGQAVQFAPFTTWQAVRREVSYPAKALYEAFAASKSSEPSPSVDLLAAQLNLLTIKTKLYLG